VASPPVAIPLWKRAHLPVWLAEWRGFRAKTPVPLDQSLVGDKQPMLDNLMALRLGTLEFIEANRNRDLSPYRFPHPFFGSLNVYDWFRMIAHHEARHTQQLREIVEFFQR
jgi:DinB superfamily